MGMARDMGVENAAGMRKQELMFAIMKKRAKAGEHDAMLMIRATDVGGVHTFSTDVIAQLPEVRTVVSVV